ncbi:MAG: ABC transporter substrate binding protein, partial [Xanthobacteraceae bacterium]
MRRREVIPLLAGAAAAWPQVARAQQQSVPTIGYLNAAASDGYVEMLRVFRRALNDSGYVEGESVAIDYRWADNEPDRLPVRAADLARRQVSVIVAASAPASLAAAKATTTIPIVFLVPEDPVRLGLVISLARPGGHATGIHDPPPRAAISELANVPAQPCECNRRDRSLRGPYCDIRASICSYHSGSRTPPAALVRCDPASADGILRRPSSSATMTAPTVKFFSPGSDQWEFG